MATTGLQILNSRANIVYNSSSVTWNQVDFVYVTAGTTFNRSYEVLANRETKVLLIMVNAPPANAKALAPTVTINATNINMSGGAVDVYAIILMR